MSLDKHLEHLRCIFKNCDNTLCVKKENCEYCSLEIMFLGHVSSQEVVKMDSRKVKAIINWHAPTKVAELRSFLGLANYYRKFFKSYSKMVQSLTDLLGWTENWSGPRAVQSLLKG